MIAQFQFIAQSENNPIETGTSSSDKLHKKVRQITIKSKKNTKSQNKLQKCQNKLQKSQNK